MELSGACALRGISCALLLHTPSWPNLGIDGTRVACHLACRHHSSLLDGKRLLPFPVKTVRTRYQLLTSANSPA